MWEAEDTQREKGRTGWGSEAEESERVPGSEWEGENAICPL